VVPAGLQLNGEADTFQHLVHLTGQAVGPVEFFDPQNQAVGTPVEVERAGGERYYGSVHLLSF